MRLASYRHGGREKFGLVRGDGVIELGERAEIGSLLEALRLERLPDLERLAERHVVGDLALDEVDLLPPVVRPGKTICVGINYKSRPDDYGHASPPSFPNLFFRAASAQVGHGAPLLRPPESEQFDFEGEIALVVGKRGRRIEPAAALSHVAGYSCFNDGSLRDWMRHGAYNVTAGKNFDASGSFGPWLATTDEIADPSAMTIETRVNGVTMQRDTTANLIHSFAMLLAYISTFTTLEPGDVIATGTPSGVGGKREPPVWLSDGDVLEIEVSGVGTLRNAVINEKVS